MNINYYKYISVNNGNAILLIIRIYDFYINYINVYIVYFLK